MLGGVTPLPADAPHEPLPPVVHVAAAALAIEALQATMLAVDTLVQPPANHTSAMDRLALGTGVIVAAACAALAAGLWRRRPAAWRWAVGLILLKCACYVLYPLAIVHYAPDAWHPGQWFGWAGLRHQIAPLITLVLLLLPTSRRAFAAGTDAAIT